MMFQVNFPRLLTRFVDQEHIASSSFLRGLRASTAGVLSHFEGIVSLNQFCCSDTISHAVLLANFLGVPAMLYFPLQIPSIYSEELKLKSSLRGMETYIFLRFGLYGWRIISTIFFCQNEYGLLFLAVDLMVSFFIFVVDKYLLVRY